MTALIPAAGHGTRFLPLTRAVPKEMLPVGAKPAVQLIVEEALAAGADDVVIVISPEKEMIRRYFDGDPELAPRIRYAVQTELRGLGHAVLQAAETVGRPADGVLILLGDALVSGCVAAAEMSALSRAKGGAGVIGLERVPREKISRYGIVKMEADGRLSDIVEKPRVEDAPSDIAVAGRYLLPTRIFDLLATQTPGHGGEIQLTDAIRRLIPENPVYGYVYPGRRHDIGNPDGYFETLAALRANH